MKDEKTVQVPFYYHEAQAARWERTNKRMIGLCTVCVALAAVCVMVLQKQQ